MIVVAADTRAGFAHGPERVLFEGRYKLDGLDSRNYDVTSDGQLFLMLRHTNEAASEPLHVVTNWFGEVRQLTSGQ